MTTPNSPKILVIEDNPGNAQLITVLLKINGFPDYEVCASGQEALVLIQKSRFNLVLLDLQLRGENGYQILKRFRENPTMTGVPIVAVTAQVMPEEVSQADEAGFNGFLGKPLNFDHFPDQIRRLLLGERVWEPR